MLLSACQQLMRHIQLVKYSSHLSELHLVHALASVPVQESLAPEHGGELPRDPLEQLLALMTSSQEIKTQQQQRNFERQILG